MICSKVKVTGYRKSIDMDTFQPMLEVGLIFPIEYTQDLKAYHGDKADEQLIKEILLALTEYKESLPHKEND